MKIWLVKSKTELIICKTDYYISISKAIHTIVFTWYEWLYKLWCKNSGFMKNEQKIPNGIEIHAVKLNISSIRYICFWTDFSLESLSFLIIYIASIPTIIFVTVRKDFNQAYSESVFDKSMIWLNDIV